MAKKWNFDVVNLHFFVKVKLQVMRTRRSEVSIEGGSGSVVFLYYKRFVSDVSDRPRGVRIVHVYLTLFAAVSRGTDHAPSAPLSLLTTVHRADPHQQQLQMWAEFRL